MAKDKKSGKNKNAAKKSEEVEKSPELEKFEESEESPEKSRKTIYIEIDDEVSSVFNKIKKCNADQVHIVVPKRAVLFQSVVNLKILKRKAEEFKKEIALITSDKNGTYLAQQIGLPVFDRINGEDQGFVLSGEDAKEKISPIKATINSVVEDLPTKIREKKLSISEILKKNRDNKVMNVSKISAAGVKKEEKKKKLPRFVIVAPNRHALIALIASSLVILLVIIYIALPGATIYLTPSASVLEKSVNITLADYQKNRVEIETSQTHMLASYPVTATVSRTISHASTGKKFSERGSNASGTITIFNTTGNAWPLITETRFQTNDGLVFRIKSPVTVPPATSNGPGSVEALVVADLQDANGQVIGERGNIEPSTFFLPGLREGSRSNLYAKNSEAFTGGVTDFVEFVSAEDLEAARARIRDELVNAAKQELQAEIARKEELSGGEVEYVLLNGDNAIKIGEPTILVDDSLVNQELAEFTVSGEVVVSGVYYARDEMLAILKDELILKKSPQKELLRVNEDSTSYRIFEWDENSGKIKLTANIKGIEQYQISPDEENGRRLLEKIKDHIVGEEIETAEIYIQNLPEINKVEIDSWPAWSPTIPNIPDNIKFEIRPAVKL